MLRQKFLQYYQIFCNLSLDVVLGVICCMLPLPICFHVHLSLGWYIGLPAATWLVYLSDHLLDAMRNPELVSPRHSFIRAYANQIKIVIGALCLLCIYLAITDYSIVLFLTAFTTGLFCVLYFLLTNLRNTTFSYFYNKELLVACIYATAIYMAIGLSQQALGHWFLYYISLLSIAYINLLFESIIEQQKDIEQRQFSWVLIIGERRSKIVFYAVSIFTLFICIGLSITETGLLQWLALTYTCMTMAHIVLFVCAFKLLQNELYRKLGEMIFWLPLLVYLIKK